MENFLADEKEIGRGNQMEGDDCLLPSQMKQFTPVALHRALAIGARTYYYGMLPVQCAANKCNLCCHRSRRFRPHFAYWLFCTNLCANKIVDPGGGRVVDLHTIRLKCLPAGGDEAAAPGAMPTALTNWHCRTFLVMMRILIRATRRPGSCFCLILRI